MKGPGAKKELSSSEREKLLGLLKARFEKNMSRHKGLEWAKVQARLDAHVGNIKRTTGLLVPCRPPLLKGSSPATHPRPRSLRIQIP